MVGIRTTAAFLIVFCIGCSRKPISNTALPLAAEEALRESTDITLFSLDPEIHDGSGLPRMRGFCVLGQVAIQGSNRNEVVQAIRQDIAGWEGKMDLCFYPRHAVRATYNGVSYDFLICYQCSNLQVFDSSDRPPAVIGVSGTGDVFNKILHNAGIAMSIPKER
jgi:hypothetical protein